ncbi:MAG: hypothetical protein ACR2JA_10430 [Hydrogenophaga sp.]|uniref:hypothetical protein n=1 Tax=Hydrogenophaga sp. TaxID=1904254 RepID=UPI003D9B380A
MNPDTAHTVQQLSHYLWRHPNACDTAEGIARWWLLDARTSPPLPVVMSALDHLQALGLVQAHRAADGRVRYRRPTADAAHDAQLQALAQCPWEASHPAPRHTPPPRMH